MFVQFGYVVLFSSAFPLAAMCALVNNIIEIRSDAFKLCSGLQRPLGLRVESIGQWQVRGHGGPSVWRLFFFFFFFFNSFLFLLLFFFNFFFHFFLFFFYFFFNFLFFSFFFSSFFFFFFFFVLFFVFLLFLLLLL